MPNLHINTYICTYIRYTVFTDYYFNDTFHNVLVRGFIKNVLNNKTNIFILSYADIKANGRYILDGVLDDY